MAAKTSREKIPQLYKYATQLYQKVKYDGQSLKAVLYQIRHPNLKAIYAIVLMALEKDAEIQYILKKSDFFNQAKGFSVPLAYVLIAELLWGKKRLPPQGRPLKTVSGFEQIFRALCSDQNLDDKTSYSKVMKPRYVRVNTCKMSVHDAIDGFRDEGWILKRFNGDDYDQFLDMARNLEESEFMVDLHIKSLLLFPPRTTFYNHEGYKCGEIILQDKASCLPVFILNPAPGGRVLDMCAAPGNKTTQLASLVGESGKVYAVEVDAKRMETMKELIATSGANCIETLFKDVLTVDAQMVPDVEYVLVDPSCSGTGMTERFEQENALNADRIHKLTGFQIKVLKHALKSFPSVKRVVYSTCSLLPEENEAVVSDVIRQTRNFKLLNGKELLKSWNSFGSEEYDVGKYCIYSQPDKDLTIGFFIAVFERLEEGETNEFYQNKSHINSKMSKEENNDSQPESHCEAQGDVKIKKWKKKKKPEVEDIEENQEGNVNEELQYQNGDDEDVKTTKKKKKKYQDDDQDESNDNKKTKRKKKHKSSIGEQEDIQESEQLQSNTEISENIKSKKRKLKLNKYDDEIALNINNEDETALKKKKKKKRTPDHD